MKNEDLPAILFIRHISGGIARRAGGGVDGVTLLFRNLHF